MHICTVSSARKCLIDAKLASRAALFLHSVRTIMLGKNCSKHDASVHLEMHFWMLIAIYNIQSKNDISFHPIMCIIPPLVRAVACHVHAEPKLTSSRLDCNGCNRYQVPTTKLNSSLHVQYGLGYLEGCITEKSLLRSTLPQKRRDDSFYIPQIYQS